MLGPIVLDIGSTHTKVVQLDANRRGFTVVDAAIAPNCELPNHWHDSSSNSSTTSAVASSTRTTVHELDRLTMGLSLVKTLAPGLQGTRIAALLNDPHYAYRMTAAEQTQSERKTSSETLPTDPLTDHFWTRLPIPETGIDLRRLTDGLRIGVAKDAVRSLRRSVRELGWDLETVISPVSVVGKTDGIEGAAVTLIDGATGCRVVCHLNGVPILTRALRVGIRSVETHSKIDEPWRRNDSPTQQPFDRVNRLASELERTFGFLARRCQLDIQKGVVHGPLGLDPIALYRLSQVSGFQWTPWAPPVTLHSDVFDQVLPLYSMAVSTALFLGEH